MWSICGYEHLHYSDFFLSCLICGFRALIDGLSLRRSSAWKECGQVRHCATEMLGGKRRVHVFLLRLFAPNFTIADCLTQPHSFYSEDQRGNARKSTGPPTVSQLPISIRFIFIYMLYPLYTLLTWKHRQTHWWLQARNGQKYVCIFILKSFYIKRTVKILNGLRMRSPIRIFPVRIWLFIGFRITH